MARAVIRITDLTVDYEASGGPVRAVDGLTLTIAEGELFGLLGPNGAGKSTTISCLGGLRRPTSGTVLVDGIDVALHAEQAKERLGVVPQSLALYPSLSVLQNLRIFGGLFGVTGKRLGQRVDWALALAQLEQKRSALVATLSGGMKRRLNLACSLLHDPPVVVCDEPTTGVDPQSRNHLFETIRRLNEEGRTVVYTTHYMEEVEALCRRVAVIDHGRLVACDTLAGLLAATGPPRRYALTLETGCERDRLEAALGAGGLAAAAIEPEKRSLEQVFLELTGKELRDGG
jgi:ABC-2 type transport system ATP-binding protein